VKISLLIAMLESAKENYGDMEIQMPETGRDPTGVSLEDGDDWPVSWNMPDQFLMLKD
jgi:hypothetical protein